MKRMSRVLLLIGLPVILLVSCQPGPLANEVDAQATAELLVAAVMPIIDSNYPSTTTQSRAPFFTGYTQDGGGSIYFDVSTEPPWESSHTQIPSDFDRTFAVTFQDFVVPYMDDDYVLNGTIIFNFAYTDSGTSFQFVFTMWGDELSVVGGSIEDIFSLDLQALLKFDITRDGWDCTTEATGQVEGIIAGISLSVTEWAFSFVFVDPYDN